VLASLESADIDERLRATLLMLRKLTREHAVSADDMRTLLAAGVSLQQIRDALAVCFTFNTMDRLADAFGFLVLSSKGFDLSARYLLARGYHFAGK
jgi:alkylhydroperoxidase family enzyme